ncbi:MAG: GNAT family N-acetyltransferase [Anaerolineae bacterium]|jgi:GNAT superfamily N-acetyltransferase
MEITIRKATQEDCEALGEIHVSSIRGLGRSHYSDAEVEAWSRRRTPARYEEHISRRHVIVAEHGSLPVGFGTLDLAAEEITQLYVRPRYAGKGIGGLILDELLRVAREAGVREIHLKSSLNARDFYVKAGFQPGRTCKHRFRDGGEVDCIPMRKRLE